MLSGMRVLITAGAAGIGRVFAETFQAAGARVVICDLDDAALQAFGQEFPEVLARPADVSSERQVDQLFAEVEDHLGGLDILINNAGIAGPSGLVEELDLAGWQRCLAVNLDGAFLCARRAVPRLGRRWRVDCQSFLHRRTVWLPLPQPLCGRQMGGGRFHQNPGDGTGGGGDPG